MTRYRIDVPPFLVTYVEQTARRTAERVVIRFHRWLLQSGKTLSKITGSDVEAFVEKPAGKPVAQLTRNDYRYEVRRYLRWLEERGLAGPFGPHELEGYHRKPLPDPVRRFLQFLAPTRRPTTVNLYKGVLRRFHEWLATSGFLLESVDRTVCLQWAQHIHDAGIHPATRVGMLVCVRKYLDWLWEQGTVAAPGHEVIRAGDLPKKPDYLPRPLPPDTDQKLQERLQKSDEPVARGLLVMRRTGLRIGELRKLERDCVREDHAGGHFLKVPLGKMNNERLVPLDPQTLEIIRGLQQLSPADSQWLVQGARGRSVSQQTYQRMLLTQASGLPLPEALTTHRLRHTFATSLMNGGMSLLGIMKLLGHRDQRMTQRYTQIADETVGREYFEALTRISERYELPSAVDQQQPADVDPATLIQDAIRWIVRHVTDGPFQHKARLLARRLEAVRDELAQLRQLAEAASETD
jgi:site-specific recombinase XerD